MNIHEYQAKLILQEYGVPIPPFFVISHIEEIHSALDRLSSNEFVLKVQVHAGGRGKAGGVKIAKSRAEALEHGKNLIGLKIVNNQTGSEGIVAHEVMITTLVHTTKEMYLGVVIDRQNAQATLICSPQGGMEIEEVAAQFPDKILKVALQPNGSLRSYQLVQIAKFMGWQREQATQGKLIVQAICKAFIETDASLLEINPLVETTEGNLVALDAKLSIDENALYRQSRIAAFYDPTQVPKNEAKARQFDLAYVALDGNVGCMVNGAGLAMATMDIIYLHGGKPANFLDVGGGASQEKVSEGFKIILSDPKVTAVLVNIFGGIMNCITLAGGIVAAAGELELKVPLIVRMEGTNVEQGKKILADSGLPIIIANNLTEAAEKAVAASKNLS